MDRDAPVLVSTTEPSRHAFLFEHFPRGHGAMIGLGSQRAWVALAWMVTAVSAFCLNGFDDRALPRECPYYESPVTTIFNDVKDGVSGQRATIEGKIGFCQSFKYPRSASGTGYFAGGTVGDEESSYIITMGDAWCNDALVVRNCLAERATPFDPPAYALNMRPPVLEGVGASFTPTQFSLPMWDEGGYFYRAVTIRINDTCLDPFFDPAAEIRTTAFADYFMSAFNGNVVQGFPFEIDPGDPQSELLVRNYVSSRVAGCSSALGGSAAECVEAHATCTTGPVITCADAVRTRPITRYPSRVRLACRDPEYGYVWRVDNDVAPGLHFDWRLTRLTGGGGGNNGTLIDPRGAGAADVFIPANNTARNPYYDRPLKTGFWPGTTGKHTAGASDHFYIPTWLDLDAGNTAVLRPSMLDLYAGYPSHYVGSTTLGALVNFIDFDSLMEFDTLNASMATNFSYDYLPLVTFPQDRTRLSLQYVCGTPGLAADGSLEITGGAEDWTGFCDAAVNNASATWPDALNAARSTFMFMNASAPDPMPECACFEEVGIECGNADAVGDPLLFQYDYRRTANLTIDYRLEPVCRMPLTNATNLTVNNLPPLTYFPGPSSPILTNQSNVTGDVAAFLSDWPEPFTIINGTGGGANDILEWTLSPLGVMWNLSNVNRDPIAQSIRISLEVANTNGGVPDLGEVTVPYVVGESGFAVNPNQTRWIFSRSLIGQNLYGHINKPCDPNLASTCEQQLDVTYPVNLGNLGPGVLASGYVADIDTFLSAAAAAALPPCECYVNIPCDGGELLRETELDVNVTALDPPPGPPAGIPSTVNISGDCIAELEACNCEDDDCDGIVDNVLGLGDACGTSNVGRCVLGALGCNLTLSECNTSAVPKPLICLGAIYPGAERCDGQDWDCDGIINNVPKIGQPCGSSVGECVQGTWACQPPNPEPVCQGGVGPTPQDICGNGLDDDCDGLIDFPCPPSSPPPPPPAASPLIPPSAIPGASPTPPAQTPGEFQIPPLDIPAPDVSWWALGVAVLLLLCCCGTIAACIYLRRLRRWSRKRYPLFY